MKCNNCGNDFKLHVVIDGKLRNLKSRKYCLVCSPFGGHRTRPIGLEIELPKEKLCPRCGLVKESDEFYVKRTENGLFAYCKTCSKERVVEIQRNLKIQAVEYKGGACCLCGYNLCVAAMDFHHINPQDKDFNISTLKGVTLNDKVRRELDKCVLLCSRCHREVEDGFTKLPENLRLVPTEGLEPSTDPAYETSVLPLNYVGMWYPQRDSNSRRPSFEG